ncbi:hypothetical protein C9374_010964 [Naegleria lovaniensis]|uniref:Protein kinase domain-containing protein n=1 Tax=Naegleria lovaniensis TaxID=51637 RepID=A0AA88GFJ5_NAELO|nr:uncharacterized protein C9374_010964 [Naegleria lovaniensis]KAG2374394.1 hypothetical protein C9374_010964 [Naegleria lovaniensis]
MAHVLLPKNTFNDDIGDSSPSSEEAFHSSLYMNFTFYVNDSHPDVLSSSSSSYIDCSLSNPCTNVSQVVQTLNALLSNDQKDTTIKNFLSQPVVVQKFVVVQVILQTNAIMTTHFTELSSFPNLFYVFRFSSAVWKDGRVSLVGASIIDTFRTDIYWMQFSNLELQLTLYSYAGTNLGAVNCTFSKFTFETTAVIRSFNVENSSFEDSSITLAGCDMVVFRNVELFNRLTVKCKQASNFIVDHVTSKPFMEIDIRVDFSRKTLFKNVFFEDFSGKITLTSNMAVAFENCNFKRSATYLPLVTMNVGDLLIMTNCIYQQGYAFLFLNNVVRVVMTNVRALNNTILAQKSFEITSPISAVITLTISKSVSIKNSYFDRNIGLDQGSAIHSQNIREFKVSASTFTNHVGTAIYFTSTATMERGIEIQSSHFENNTCNGFGGALMLTGHVQQDTSSYMVVSASTFIRNFAKLSGGAIYAEHTSSMLITRSIFEHNHVEVQHSYFTDGNYQRGTGGALFIGKNTHTALLFQSTFNDNSASYGGGIFYVKNSVQKVNFCNFLNNRATVNGAAIFHYLPDTAKTAISFTNSSFRNNLAQRYGHNYFTSVTSVHFDRTRTIELYPGQVMNIDMKAFSYDQLVPTNVEQFQIIGNDNFLVHVHMLNHSLEVTLYLTKENEPVGTLFNTTLQYESQKTEPFLPFKLTSCPYGTALQYRPFYNLNNSAGFVCAPKPDVLAISLGVSIPLLLIFFALGFVLSYLCIVLGHRLKKKLKRLAEKEKAEKAVEQKILDKHIIFGNGWQEHDTTTTFNGGCTSYSRSLTSPLLGSQDVEYLELSEYTTNRTLSESKKQSFLISINDLEIVKRIAEGGNGVVYQAKLWKKLDVAVKSLKQNCDDDEEFEQEVSLLASLDHLNILKFYGISVTETSKYMITEYLENGSLDKMIYRGRIGNEGALNFIQKLQALEDVSCGMNYLHSLKPAIVHRDLKPGNILLDSKMTCKVCDFGLSRIVGNSSNTMTKNIGTLFYMSPELISGKTTSSSTDSYQDKLLKATKIDVFSFGIIMWELFFEIAPYSSSEKTKTFGNEIPIVNILIHVMNGGRPSIPFKNKHELSEWLDLYPLQGFPKSEILLDIILEYFEWTQKCWSEEILSRPSFEDIHHALKILKQKLSQTVVIQ